MSPTPGVPDAEPVVPNESGELLPVEGELLTAEVVGMTEIDKSITDIIAVTDLVQDTLVEPRVAGKRGRPARQTVAPITWSIRGVTRDTRTLLEQAAGRVGKTLGQYLNEDVRVCVEQQLQLTPAPTNLAALEKQVHYLRQLVENLASMVRATPPAPATDTDSPPKAS